MYSGSQPPFHRSAITQKYAYKTQRSCLFKKHLYRRHRSVSVEKGGSGRSGVRGEIRKKPPEEDFHRREGWSREPDSNR